MTGPSGERTAAGETVQHVAAALIADDDVADPVGVRGAGDHEGAVVGVGSRE